MPIAETSILICGANLKPIGDPVTGWTSIDVTLKHNEVSVGAFTAPASLGLLDVVSRPGARVVVNHDGRILISGPIEVGDEAWVRDGLGQVQINFADHLALIAGRVAYPSPALAATAQTAETWNATGPAGTLMLNLVNVNAGPGALSPRQWPGLAIAASAGLGNTVDFEAQTFEPILDALRRLSVAGGGVGFRVVQIGRTWQFQVFTPRDRSGHVRYSIQLGNLNGLRGRREAPTATVAIAGFVPRRDAGDPPAPPVVREVVDTPAVTAGWGRLETFASASTGADNDAMDQAANAAIAEKAEKVGIVVDALDGPGKQYGLDYIVGDYVGVELGNGQAITDLVTQVQVQITSAGAVIAPRIGTGEVATSSATSAAMRAMDRRIGRLERS